MKLFAKLLVVTTAGLILAGCETLGDKEDVAPEGAAVVEERAPGAEAAGVEGAAARGAQAGAAFQGHPLDDPASPLSNRVVYFEFDSATVRPEDRDVVKAHAEYLGAHPAAAVVLEGHADERGTREYNVALGERRSQAVSQLLLFQGASTNQMESVSYGEERPAAIGHNEDAWQLNRRVEIIYKSR